MVILFPRTRVVNHSFLVDKSRLVTSLPYKTSGHSLDLLEMESFEEINQRWVGHDGLLSMELVHDLFFPSSHAMIPINSYKKRPNQGYGY